jgi:phage terminase Nu1 subunit (DNA packaging protein)
MSRNLVSGYVIYTHMKFSTVSSPENEERLTGPELARALKVKAGTVRAWRVQGCPAQRINYKLVFYRLSEVERWLIERAAKETSSPQKKEILAKGRNKLRVVRKRKPAKAK